MPKLSIIIPCYYNEANIPITAKELIDNEKLFPEDVDIEYVLIDDGSKDATLKELLAFKAMFPDRIRVIKLSGNFGSYNALQAGMAHATGDCNVVISADLQDPPEIIVKMYDYWVKGFKLVLANREDREDSFLNKLFSQAYQRIIKKYALPNLPKGGFDCVLFDKQLRAQVVELKDGNTNSLYLLTWLKYDYACVPYVRRKRILGKSKWTFKKKVKLLVDSFVSFSYTPLRVIAISGLTLGVLAVLFGLYVILAYLNHSIKIEGWTSLMVVFLFVSAFQMLALGIIGEYLWRNLEASRKRPPYVIDEIF